MAPQTFFNLPAANAVNNVHQKELFGNPFTRDIPTNWSTFTDQKLTSRSLIDVFANRTPVVRVKGFLDPEECQRMLQVVRTHDIVGTWEDVEC
jgi:hypothetical protein